MTKCEKGKQRYKRQKYSMQDATRVVNIGPGPIDPTLMNSNRVGPRLYLSELLLHS